MPQVHDSVRCTTVTTGTGNLSLSVTPPDGFRSPLSVFQSNERFPYTVRLGTEWESGVGYHNGTALVRESPREGSAGDRTLVNFSAGTKDVYVGPLAFLASRGSPGRYFALARGIIGI